MREEKNGKKKMSHQGRTRDSFLTRLVSLEKS
jgi:hypothetical protein